MPAHPDAVLRRLTDRLAPLERDLHRALWAAATDARPETSAARRSTGVGATSSAGRPRGTQQTGVRPARTPRVSGP